MKDFGLIPGAYSVRDLLDRGVYVWIFEHKIS